MAKNGVEAMFSGVAALLRGAGTQLGKTLVGGNDKKVSTVSEDEWCQIEPGVTQRAIELGFAKAGASKNGKPVFKWIDPKIEYIVTGKGSYTTKSNESEEG